MLFLIHKELFLKFDEWTLQAEGWLPTVSRKPFGTLVVRYSRYVGLCTMVLFHIFDTIMRSQPLIPFSHFEYDNSNYLKSTCFLSRGLIVFLKKLYQTRPLSHFERTSL